MQAAEVRGRVVQKGYIAVEMETDDSVLFGNESVSGGCWLGLEGEDKGGLEVEGVDLRVGFVEAGRIGGEGRQLEDRSVIKWMKRKRRKLDGGRRFVPR